ncbi:MAG: hypothetical protein M0024_10570 [Nitrospiraceae bacterium]|nr:hypothetical protein [Nitrospiraceae bacterium]
MAAIKCQRCSNQMAESERFCSECGWERPAEHVAEASALSDSTANTGKEVKEDIEFPEPEMPKKSTTTSPTVRGKANRTSRGALAGVVGVILIIAAGIGGYFYYHGSQPIAVQPVVTTPVTTQQETPKPAEPVAEPQKSEDVHEQPAHTIEKTVVEQKPMPEPKKAQAANVTPKKAVVKQKTEVVKETLPAKITTVDTSVKTSTPAASQDVGHTVSQVQTWLRNNNMYVVASVKNDVIVLKGAVKPEEKARLTARMKEMGVNYKDFVSVDLTTN